MSKPSEAASVAIETVMYHFQAIAPEQRQAVLDRIKANIAKAEGDNAYDPDVDLRKGEVFVGRSVSNEKSIQVVPYAEKRNPPTVSSLLTEIHQLIGHIQERTYASQCLSANNLRKLTGEESDYELHEEKCNEESKGFLVDVRDRLIVVLKEQNDLAKPIERLNDVLGR